MVSLGTLAERKQQFAKVAEQLFSKPFSPDAVVQETLVARFDGPPAIPALAEVVATGVNLAAPETELHSHPTAAWLESHIALQGQAGQLVRNTPRIFSAVVSELALTQPGELEARRDPMRILREKSDCERLIPKLTNARERAEKEFRRVTKTPDAAVTENTLRVEKTGLEKEETLIPEMRQRDGAGDLLPAQRDKLIEQLADLAQKLEDTEADGKKAKLALDFHEGRIAQGEHRKQLVQMPLRAAPCSAPLDMAVAHGCKLAETLHPNRFSEHVLAELKTNQGALQARVSSFQEQVTRLKREQSEGVKQKQRVEKQIGTAREKHKQRIETFQDYLALVRRKYEVT